MHPYVHCSVIYNSQEMEAAQVPISRQLDKEDVVYRYNGLLLSHEKQYFTTFNSMDGPRGYYANYWVGQNVRLVFSLKDTFFIFPNKFIDLDILSMLAISCYWLPVGGGQGCC